MNSIDINYRKLEKWDSLDKEEREVLLISLINRAYEQVNLVEFVHNKLDEISDDTEDYKNRFGESLLRSASALIRVTDEQSTQAS